jgi:hypothetical protein
MIIREKYFFVFEREILDISKKILQRQPKSTNPKPPNDLV